VLLGLLTHEENTIGGDLFSAFGAGEIAAARDALFMSGGRGRQQGVDAVHSMTSSTLGTGAVAGVPDLNCPD